MHVRTSEIAWIGEPELNEISSGVQNLSIKIENVTFPSNVH